jgi:hypothetical protein
MQLGEWVAAERAEGEEREMNPLDWKRQHQVAGIAFCILGAITGVFFAWMVLAVPTVVFALSFRRVG